MTGHHAQLYRSVDVSVLTVPAEGEVQDEYYEQFSVDDARALVGRAHTRPVGAAVLTVVIRVEAITLEAQNALLKVVEEPPATTRFVFVVGSNVDLLPTLRSRLQENQKAKGATEQPAAFTTFLAAPYAERIQSVERAVKAKDLSWQRAIKAGLTEHLLTPGVEPTEDLVFIARWLLTRGASNKMLLEQLALTLPLDHEAESDTL